MTPICVSCQQPFISIVLQESIVYFWFSSSDLFLSSSLLAGSPRFSEITGPGLAWWCLKVAAPPLVALVSTSWMEWEEAVESEDSFATWSVMPRRKYWLVVWSCCLSAGLSTMVELTASGFFFLGVGRHGDGLGLICRFECIVIKSDWLLSSKCFGSRSGSM